MTDVPSWNRVKEIFQAALALPPRERSAFVRKSCGTDAALRAEVESLLDSLDDAGSFGERPAIQSLTVDTSSAGGVDVASALRAGDALGPYTIVALLGAGGMGQVYRARDPKLNRDVALKILPAEFAKDEDRLARFRREAQVLASLNHPNIGHIYGLEDNGARAALVLELVEGPTLAEMIAGTPGRQRLPLDESLPVAQQIAEALEAAHEHGVVHRDLKPANVKVRPDGLVKVLDFGLARALDPAPASSAEAMESPTMTSPQGWTESGVILGTAPYMSPEQARGKVVDKRGDIWAFGCVLFEMLTGRRPFGGETSSDTIAAILTRDPDWTALPRTTPPRLRALLQRCLEKDPKRRLRDIGEARIEIEQLIDESKQPHGPQRRSIGRWIAVSVGLMLLLVIPFGWYYLYLSKSRPQGPLRFTQLTDFSDTATAASLSPDGRMVTFIRGGSYFQNPNRVGQIYVKVLPNGEPVRLTNDPMPKYAPVFTPDSSRVVYSVHHEDVWDTWTVPIVGGAPTMLLPNATGLSWMSDGRILFSEVKTGMHMGIVTATEARADSREIYFPEHERAMAHYSHGSPDRKWVLIVEMGAGGGFNQPCRIVPFDGSSSGRLVGPRGACRAAAWSPGGDWMYFAALVDGRQHLWRQAFPNGEPEQITFDPTEEEGVAVAPDGNSIVTSVGEQRSGIWIHDEAGERQVRSEGNAAMPRISRDGRWVLFIQEGELLQVDVASGKSVSVLPGIKVGFGYDISADDTELAITRPIQNGKSEIWLASLGRRFAPRLVTRGGDLVTFGPNGTLIFRELDKNANYLARVNRDGSGRERVLDTPILNKTEVSPNGEWAIVNRAATGDDAAAGRVETVAIPVGGGAPRRLCQFNCLPASKWSRDGKYLQLEIGGQTAIIPIPPGQSLPDLPASGVTSIDNALTVPGARRIAQQQVIASLSASTYLFLKTELRRNLFRIQLR